MDAVLVVAVKENQIPFVVVLVAPPQLPVGAAFPAPCRSPVVYTQFIDGFRVTGDKQSACAFRKLGTNENRMGIKILTKRMDFINQFWLRTRIIGQRLY